MADEWRGQPVYRSPDGKFATLDKAVWDAWQAEKASQAARNERLKQRAATPEIEVTDATNNDRTNGDDADGVADRRGDGDGNSR